MSIQGFRVHTFRTALTGSSACFKSCSEDFVSRRGTVQELVDGAGLIPCLTKRRDDLMVRVWKEVPFGL